MRKIAIVSSIAGLGLVLTACGSQSEQTQTSPSAAETVEGGATTTLEPKSDEDSTEPATVEPTPSQSEDGIVDDESASPGLIIVGPDDASLPLKLKVNGVAGLEGFGVNPLDAFIGTSDPSVVSVFQPSEYDGDIVLGSAVGVAPGEAEVTITVDGETTTFAVEVEEVPGSTDPSPTSNESLAVPDETFEGEITDLGTVEASVGDRISVPVPTDVVFGGGYDYVDWDFEVVLDPTIEQADLERTDVGKTISAAENKSDQSGLIYDVVAPGNGSIQISFTHPETKEASLIKVEVVSK